jgi:hypothetical protein
MKNTLGNCPMIIRAVILCLVLLIVDECNLSFPKEPSRNAFQLKVSQDFLKMECEQTRLDILMTILYRRTSLWKNHTYHDQRHI